MIPIRLPYPFAPEATGGVAVEALARVNSLRPRYEWAGSTSGQTLYFVTYADGGADPTGAQIVAGQDATGSAALDAASTTPASGTNDWPSDRSALPPGDYRDAMVGYDGTDYTLVSVSGVWTVAAAGVTVDLSVTDSADTLASSAAALVLANASVTDAPDTLAADAGVLALADASLGDDADALSAAAAMAVTASLEATDAADTLSSDATVVEAGAVLVDLSATDAADTLSADASALVQVSADLTDAPDTLAAASTSPVTADLSRTDDADTLESSVFAIPDAIIVDFIGTDAADTLAAVLRTRDDDPLPAQKKRGLGGLVPADYESDHALMLEREAREEDEIMMIVAALVQRGVIHA